MLYAADVLIMGVGSPKGGVGKTTIAVTTAALYADAGARVLVVDADTTTSASDWIAAAGDAIPVDVDTVDQPRLLRRLRTLTQWDVCVIDLPGARKGGELGAILDGDGTPVADLLLMPTEAAEMDLRVITRTVPEVRAAGVPCRVVLSRVPPASIGSAVLQRDQMRASGVPVADTIVRRYQVVQDAVGLDLPVHRIGGGRHTTARQSESDFRALAREAAGLLPGGPPPWTPTAEPTGLPARAARPHETTR